MIASSTVLPVICLANGTSFLTEVLKSCDLSRSCLSCFLRTCAFVNRPLLCISRITILRSHRIRDSGSGSNAAAIVFGFLINGTPAATLVEPSGFGPASSSSSKIEEDARSPRMSCGVVGFFLRYSSVSGFLGAALVSWVFFLPKRFPKRKRRWEGRINSDVVRELTTKSISVADRLIVPSLTMSRHSP